MSAAESGQTTAPETDPEIGSLIALALRAGDEIMSVYARADVEAVQKSDGSPVTEADGRAERVILDGLRAGFPAVPVVAEEAVEAGTIPDASDRFFLVDPLDGTKEFLNRIGEFTVNIALVDAGVPVFGVVYAPALGEIYWGGRLPGLGVSDPGDSGGACVARVVQGRLVDVTPIRVRAVPENEICALVSRSHGSAETEALIAGLNVSKRVSVGSSLKLCWVAAGRADIYPRLTPTMQWDIAAGHAIVRAAGGCLLELPSRACLAYRMPANATKRDLTNPGFVALSHIELLPDCTGRT
ncbi:3'(2'),5'-bisphosphate nucleotidase CysQ [Roseibium aquae]|uniref:3'(2'),5'-bisphosphate nucleotidase CysQ n=1 Tax=Roseibium aquae TaxID=1323746 RepID=A0A916X2F5_9HYPH|nr:3'(2'),5'-bisphosphate nucleotidase CysQ [Roseibium aquae]GGB49972.1 3'(2'),5'-bisphosphate nucleotidase CysQ [Roseibium aquae]